MTATLFAAVGPTDSLVPLGGVPLSRVHRTSSVTPMILGYKASVAPRTDLNLAIDEAAGVGVLYDGWLSNVTSLAADLGVDYTVRDIGDDAELILRAYLSYGEAFVEKLNGHFCAIIADPRLDRVLLAVDPFASHPLFIRKIGAAHFISTAAQALALLSPRASIDREAFLELLYRQTVRSPGTIFEDVLAVEPGSMMLISGGSARTRRYWTWTFTPEPMTGEEAIGSLETALADATSEGEHRHYPHFVALSGGIDSSLVACYLARADGPLSPVTVAVNWSSSGMDETIKARIVADSLHRPLNAIQVNPIIVPKLLRAHIALMDQPCPLGLGITLLSEGVDPDTLVGLSGLGADELFFGYPEVNQRLFSRTITEVVDTYLKISALFPDNVLVGVGEVLGISFAQIQEQIRGRMVADLRSAASDSPISAVATLLIRNFLIPGDLYSYRLFAASRGIRVRHPFLDRRIVQLAGRIPLSLSAAGAERVGKPLLRRIAYRAGLPRAIWGAPKHGFGVPALELIRGSKEAFGWLAELSSKDDLTMVLNSDSIFGPRATEAQSPLVAYRTWARLAISAWLRHFQSAGLGK